MFVDGEPADGDDEIERIRAKKLAELMKQSEKPPAQATKPAELVVLTDSNFARTITSTPLVLVDFWAVWCQPCKVIAPAVEELAKKYSGKLTVGKMNVDENQMVPGQFGIQSIPTLLLFKGGRLVDGVVGAVPKAQLENLVRKWM